jgi:hypothetical protein
MLREIAGALRTEFRSLEARGPRGTAALAAAMILACSGPTAQLGELTRSLAGRTRPIASRTGSLRASSMAVWVGAALAERGVCKRQAASGNYKVDVP